MKSQVFDCPSCHQPFQVLAEQAGQLVQCPTCDQTVEVPASKFAPAIASPSDRHSQSVGQTTTPELVSVCIHCQLPFGITAEMYGSQVACPHCQRVVEISNPTNKVLPIEIDTRKNVKYSKLVAREAGKSSRQAAKSSCFDVISDLKKRFSKEQEHSRAGSEKPVPKEKSTDNRDDANSNLNPSNSAPGAQPRETTARFQSKKSIDDLLPPTVKPDTAGDGHSPGRSDGKDEVRQNPKTGATATNEAVDPQPEPVDHLLPPKFEAADPALVRVGRASEFKILLPDGDGGVQQIDQRIVTIEHAGEKVSLVALTPQQRNRRRMIANTIAILLGIATLAIAFTLLT